MILGGTVRRQSGVCHGTRKKYPLHPFIRVLRLEFDIRVSYMACDLQWMADYVLLVIGLENL